MADIDKTGSISIPADALNKHFVLKNTIDFTVTANQLATTKNMAIFDIPANVLVQEVLMNVTTADADISDVDIGIYGVSVDGIVDGATIAVAGWIRDVAGEAYSPPTGYIATTDKVVYFTNNDAQTINEAVIEFFAVCIDLN